MTDWMIHLRRSPRKLLERDGHPGPGAGHLALVLARAGVGKTAFLVGIGIDALLANQRVLHVSLEGNVDKVRTWYEDLLLEMLRREKKLEHWAAIQLDVERRRHIHAYLGDSFTSDRLKSGVEMLRDVMDFQPDVLLIDDLDLEKTDPSMVEEIKALAAEVKAEVWMSSQIHRDGPQAEDGHLPPPADKLEEQVDLAFRLNTQDSKMRLHLLKDRDQLLEEDLHIILDPQTMLINVSFAT